MPTPKILRRLLAAALLALLPLGHAAAAPPFYAMTSITLLQPDSFIAERLPGGAPALAAYIQAINAAVMAKLAAGPAPAPAGIALIVALRPNGTSNAWVGTKSVLLAPERDAIIAAARAVKPPSVTGGTVVFAIDVSLGGGAAPTGGTDLPLPAEWTKGGGPTEITALVDTIWPAKP